MQQLSFPFLNERSEPAEAKFKRIDPHSADGHWWDERRSKRLFEWRLSNDEQWYLGEAESVTIRLSSLAGFHSADPDIEVLKNNVWTALNRRVIKWRERAALWREARYSLIVRNDLGPPNESELFDAFLSYASDDAFLAETLAKALRSAGFQIWFDKWYVPLSRSLPLEHYLRYGIKRSSALIRLGFDYGPLAMFGLEEFHGFENQDRWFGHEREIMAFARPGGYVIQVQSPRRVAQSLEQLDADATYRGSVLHELCDFDEMVASLTNDLRNLNRDSIAERVWLDEDPSIYVTSYSRALRRLAKRL